MFNFIVAWGSRRKAKKAAEQKARDEARFVRAFIDASKRADDRRLAEQRTRANAITPPDRVGQGSALCIEPDNTRSPTSSLVLASLVSQLGAGGGTFDGAGASGDWSGSSCSSSSSDLSSGSSDSGSSCSSD